MEDWEKELEEEMERRNKNGAFLDWDTLSSRMSIAFASWDDYHEGSNKSILMLLKQLGWKNPSALELGYFHIFNGPGAASRHKKNIRLNTGYLFVYSDGKLSAQKLKKIKFHLGIDLKEKYNLDEWSL